MKALDKFTGQIYMTTKEIGLGQSGATHFQSWKHMEEVLDCIQSMKTSFLYEFSKLGPFYAYKDISNGFS